MDSVDHSDQANFIENTLISLGPTFSQLRSVNLQLNIMLILKICQNFGIITNITLVKITGFSELSVDLKIIEEVFSKYESVGRNLPASVEIFHFKSIYLTFKF